MGFVRSNLTTILVAMVTAAVTAGGPAIAATIADYAKNADKVDGKHAVAASATVTERRNKLVATNSVGRLPNNIIAKAQDSDQLDGLDSKQLARNKAQPAEMLTGGYAAFGTGQGYLGDYVQFPRQLPSAIAENKMIFVPTSGAATANCPGQGQAAEGFLCVYEVANAGRTLGNLFRTDVNDGGATAHGFGIYFYAIGANGSGSYSLGSWTYHVPN